MESISHTVQETHTFSLYVDQERSGARLDVFLSAALLTYSRTFLQRLIKNKQVVVNGAAAKSSMSMQLNDRIDVTIPTAPPLYNVVFTVEQEAILRALDVRILFTHDHFLIIEKPAGLLIHKPSSYCTTITLIDWLLWKDKELAQVGNPQRPGIVHRLDKDTSGLMIIPRSNYAHAVFGAMFKERSIKKIYYAFVEGHPPREGVIDIPLGRDPIKRNQRITHGLGQRNAVTTYTVKQYFDTYSLVEVHPLTGRTHQIRVHFKAIGHSLVGDTVYGTRSPLIARHALHAAGLQFIFDNNHYNFESPMPADMQALLASIETA